MWGEDEKQNKKKCMWIYEELRWMEKRTIRKYVVYNHMICNYMQICGFVFAIILEF